MNSINFIILKRAINLNQIVSNAFGGLPSPDVNTSVLPGLTCSISLPCIRNFQYGSLCNKKFEVYGRSLCLKETANQFGLIDSDGIWPRPFHFDKTCL